VQSDLKRILAYSTISQLGYMFLALGVGATAAANFHLMTHAFFKALLFLGAGGLIHCLDHQHNIFKMGGLRKSMPLITSVFIIGCAALASLPLLSGFYSKELILSQVIGNGFNWLWAGGLLGAFMTAFYSARLVLVVFFGQLKQQPSAILPKSMGIVLTILIGLSIIGGIMPSGLARLFPVNDYSMSSLHHYLPIITPFIALALAYWSYRRGLFGGTIKSPLVAGLHQLLLSGWRFDQLYQTLLVAPFFALTQLNRKDLIDKGYRLLESLMINLHSVASRTQTGSLRLYNASLLILVIIGIAWLIFSGSAVL
jgi:NADH-quinone oxidoreductase subunit L